MRYPPHTALAHTSRLACLIAIFLSGCHEGGPPAPHEEMPAQALLRLTLPEMPQLQPKGEANRQNVAALLAETETPYSRAQAQFLNHLAAQSPVLALALQSAGASPVSQSAQLAELLYAPPAALILQPIEPLKPATIASLKSLREAGCYLIALAPSPARQPLFDTSVSCDPSKIGKSVASMLIKALTKRAVDFGQPTVTGRVMTLRGSDTDPVGKRIQEGFEAGLASQSGIVVVHDAPADWSLSEAKNRFAEALRLQQPIDAVFAHDDLLTQAVHEAATELGVRDDLFLVGVNGFAGNEGGIEMIRNNQLDATCQRPFLVDVAWRLIQRHLAGEPPPDRPHILLSPRPIVPADLDTPAALHPLVDDL